MEGNTPIENPEAPTSIKSPQKPRKKGQGTVSQS